MVGNRTTQRLLRPVARAAVVASICASSSATLGGSGIFNSFVVVNSGSGNVFYDLASTTGNPNWQGTTLGPFFAGGSTNGSNALTLNGGELQTFQNSGDNINGAFINYKLSGSFTEFSILFNSEFPSFGSNTGDKKWQTTGQGIAMLNGLAPGNYNFEVFGRASGQNGAVNFSLFANNGGANYTATFTVNISDFLWDGGPGGGDGNTSTANNWSSNIAPGMGHNLAFAGSTNTSVNNTLASVNKITFNSGANPFTFGGAALVVNGGGIINASGSVQTVNTNVTLGANQSFDTGTVANGALAIGGTVNTNGKSLIVTGSNNGTFNNVVSGTGSLTKQGGGRLTMAAGVTHTYSGTTTVSNGALIVNGTHNGGDNYTVASGATLGGGGTIAPASAKNVSIAGNVSPGNSVGSLTLSTTGGNGTTTGVTELAAGGSYTWEIKSQSPGAGTSWDLLKLDAVAVTATTTPGQKFTIKIVSLTNDTTAGPIPGWTPGSPEAPKTYTIATSTTNSFAGIDLNKFFVDTTQFADAYPTGWAVAIGNSGGSLDLVYVPEPGSVATIIGSSAILLRRRRRV